MTTEITPAGFLPAVKYLVEECGAGVNARDHEGGTPSITPPPEATSR